MDVPKEFAKSGFARSHRFTRESRATKSLDSSKTMAGMLLAAVGAAMLVVVDQVIDTWADGHLMVVWVGLWAVAFAMLSYLTPTLRHVSAKLAVAAQRWVDRQALRRAEDNLWDLAQQDYRLMDEVRAARVRGEDDTR